MMRLSQSLLALTLVTAGACASSNPSPAPPGASSASLPTAAAGAAHVRADGCPEGYGGLVGQPCDGSMEGKMCGPEHPETMKGFIPVSLCTRGRWEMLEAPPPPGGPIPRTLTRAHDAPSPGADAAAPAPSASVPTGPPPDPALIFACTANSDCTAVTKNMCCPDGTLEAVNALEVDAYRKSWNLACAGACTSRPKQQDTRVAECGSSHKCEMCKPAAHGKCGK